MLFNSIAFILAFLPVAFVVYFALCRAGWIVAAQVWLVGASLFFYGYWNIHYLPLIVASLLFNFTVGRMVAASPAQAGRKTARKVLLAVGITANLATLGYFKYTDFLVGNWNVATGAEAGFPGIVLPLAISFFTFQQVGYPVDIYRGETAGSDVLRYALFVSFFPQLIAGPIVRHHEVMSQFMSRGGWVLRNDNVLRGLFIFSIGLFKKVMIADTFAPWADAGFDGGQPLDFFSAWAASLAYTFQLYFDFSGYCDMAIGAALLFNIRLPLNFNSPYKALDIRDFWRRWHITLGRFLRDYLYFPLGGSRGPEWRTHANLLATFILGGLWHGASWMFVIWGAMHGLALVVHRAWRRAGLALPAPLAWAVTFLFVNASWVFFRANTLDDAWRVLAGMADFGGAFDMTVADIATAHLAWAGWAMDDILRIVPAGLAANLLPLCAAALALALIARRNAYDLMAGPITPARSGLAAILAGVAIVASIASTSTVFLYFNF